MEGDRKGSELQMWECGFQSTPSEWRVTLFSHTLRDIFLFQSTPSEWRVTKIDYRNKGFQKGFQSTPSEWRVTKSKSVVYALITISIHTLRVEGDRFVGAYCPLKIISIHTLRVEGDRLCSTLDTVIAYFNPHPPSGG